MIVMILMKKIYLLNFKGESHFLSIHKKNTLFDKISEKVLTL